MHLVPITPELVAMPAVRSSELLLQVCQAMIALYPDGKPLMPWSGYLARESDAFIGTCAFKTPPQAGAAEIAYFTFPGNEGRGVATRMARSLVELGRLHGLRMVCAQTLPQANASSSILRKLGFTLTGELLHPDDGTVWEWRLELAV